MMNKFVDGVDFVPPGTPPGTPSQLFNELGVWTEPRSVQQAAVDQWLEHNEPVPNLRLMLQHRGFMSNGNDRH